ncbi:MAG: hypothetical protein NWS62_00195, partial [Gaiellales bacterium]|nr:hypothetical protein [Gaiellales bacterium]
RLIAGLRTTKAGADRALETTRFVSLESPQKDSATLHLSSLDSLEPVTHEHTKKLSPLDASDVMTT